MPAKSAKPRLSSPQDDLAFMRSIVEGGEFESEVADEPAAIAAGAR